MGNTVGSQKQTLSDDYIAGFFDGDGSIVATLEMYQSKRYPYRVRLKANFAQHVRHIRILETIQQMLGGVGAIRTVIPKQYAELVIQNRTELKILLERLMPKLFLKKRQAQLALEALKALEGNQKHQPSNLSEKAYARILDLIRNIRALNAHSGGKRRNV
jgi:intein/homing endonuclease